MDGIKAGVTILLFSGIALGGLYVSKELQDWFAHPFDSLGDLIKNLFKWLFGGIKSGGNWVLDWIKSKFGINN